jgi:hypothetical protein
VFGFSNALRFAQPLLDQRFVDLGRRKSRLVDPIQITGLRRISSIIRFAIIVK